MAGWVDFANSEGAASIRTKLNNSGADVEVSIKVINQSS